MIRPARASTYKTGCARKRIRRIIPLATTTITNNARGPGAAAFVQAQKPSNTKRSSIAISVEPDTASGTFTISGLPAGKYTVEVWHEIYTSSTVDVTVPEGGKAEANFTLKDKTLKGKVPRRKTWSASCWSGPKETAWLRWCS